MKRYCLAIFILTAIGCSLFAQQKKPIVLDADTGNEVDDLYAIVRALVEPTWDVVALNATQWQPAHWAVEQTMEESYRLNQVLLGYLDMSADVPSLRGATNRMFDWGYLAQHSAASYNLIQLAKSASPTDKLDVIALGALTNVASAIYIDPDIIPNMRLHWLGSTYDFEKGIFNNRDFNCMMDPQALEEILRSEIELHIIPVSVASKMTMKYEETKDRLEGKHGVCDFIVDRWYLHLDGGRIERTIWDLALIEAIIHPEMASQKEVQLSKRYGERLIHYYNDIDANAMRSDFYQTLDEYFQK